MGHPPAVKDIDSYGEYRSSYYVRRWGNIDSFLSEIGRTRTTAGLPRRYTKDEVVAIYSCIKVLLSLVYENDNYKVTQTVLEKIRFNDGTLISPTTFTKKFGSWKEFCEYVERNTLDSALERITNKIRNEGIEVLLSNLGEE